MREVTVFRNKRIIFEYGTEHLNYDYGNKHFKVHNDTSTIVIESLFK